MKSNFLDEWLDDSFWKEGAFITSPDGKEITLGKNGVLEYDHYPPDNVPMSSLSSKEKFGHRENEKYFFLKNFYHSKTIYYVPQDIISLPIEELVAHLKKKPAMKATKIKELNSADLEIYEKDFHDFKKRKDLEKVVLITREEYQLWDHKDEYRDIQPSTHFFIKALTFDSGFPYGLWNHQSPINLAGVTPEILYHKLKNKIFTYALAGTGSLSDGEKLLKSPKDLHEHKIVIKDIQEKLSSLTSKIEVSKTYLYPFKDLVHLKTDIVGELRDEDKMNVQSILKELTPTAALGGYPHQESQDFLKKSSYFQKYPERFFGSSFGFNNGNNNFALVAIRNIQWKKNLAFIESGGGVVHESKLSQEKNELKLKRNIIKEHFLLSN